jgi:hypothetical protein
MSQYKTIQLNPIFLSGSAKASSLKREKKEKPHVSIKPNKMKKQLLAKIKDFQHKTEQAEVKKTDIIKAEEEFDEGFADEFNKSLNFLSELSKQRKQKPHGRNETLKKGKVEQAVHLQISTELPEELQVKMPIQPVKVKVSQMPIQPAIQMPMQPAMQPAIQMPMQPAIQPAIQMPMQPAIQPAMPMQPTPLYSNLKGGSRPTYRQYHNKTQKNYGTESVVKPLIHIDTATATATATATNPKVIVPSKKPRFKKRVTKTLKYSLGKHKNGKVSVLIKNAKTRRKIQTEQALLRQKTIPEIKTYLRTKNLLKVGSEVPNDVLRQMYESAILAGDVTNKSKDTLIHNYFHEK